jgi:TonB family protein
MRSLSKLCLTGAGVALFLASPVARGQEPTGASLPTATDGSVDVTPPSLKDHPAAAYPADARRDRIEGSVGIEVSVDANGHVEGARVTQPAGHGFDEAALAAIREWTFEPARRSGAPIAATVQLAYPFELPAAPPLAAATPAGEPTPPAGAPSAAQPRAAGEPALQEETGSTLVLGRRPISAASSFAVRDRDFSLRPVGSVQDILRVTPGLVMVQHSGGGKANQYFLRGFDADHGTDVALSIDGIPINMVSHAHGQGFSDTNFIIPETVERVEITKGPYFANQGDFATAGAVNLVTRDGFEHSSLGFGAGGSPGHGSPSYRGLLVASPKWDTAKATFAVEVGRQDGPFDNPEGWDRYKLFNKLTFALTPTSSLSIGESSYSGNWHGSGQIPSRAVDQGIVSRFGSIDPNEGGNTARHQVFLIYKLRPSETSEVNAVAFLGTYRFNLFSNFTLYARDPENGDEIEQTDRRTFYGGKVSYRIVHELEHVRFDTTIGADVRSDDIHEKLLNTRQRIEIATVRDNSVHETMLGAHASEEITPVKWLRFNAGLRADLLSFAVDNQLATNDPANPRSGTDGAHQFSPKASAILTPIDAPGAQLDVYANYGNGLHSNDVRGVFTNPAVTPLTRAIGEEVGARSRLFERWDFAAALWRLALNNETVWGGDDGTTSVSDATLRYGVELETRLELTKWLAADGDVTLTHSQFSTDKANGGGLALAPKQTWSGGLSARHEAGPGTVRGGLRFFGIADRPASDDGAIIAPGFTQVDLHLGYRHRRFDVAFDIENLLNGAFRSAQFDTVSRLRTEPGIGGAVPRGFSCGSNARLATNPTSGAADGRFYGCEDVNFTPAYPITARLMATLFLD